MARLGGGARRLQLLLVVIAGALLLSGCIEAKMDTQVSSANTVSGTFKVGIDKEFLGLLAGGEEELFEELASDGCQGPGFRQDRYNEGRFVGIRCSMDGVSLGEFNGLTDGDITLIRDGDTFLLSGTVDFNEESGQEAPPPGASDILGAAEVEFTFTFPGAIASTTGVQSDGGRTVTFTPDPLGVVNINATADAAGSGLPVVGDGALRWIVPAAGVLAVVGLGLLVFVLLRRNRAAAEGPVVAGPPPGGYPPPDGYGQQPQGGTLSYPALGDYGQQGNYPQGGYPNQPGYPQGGGPDQPGYPPQGGPEQGGNAPGGSAQGPWGR